MFIGEPIKVSFGRLVTLEKQDSGLAEVPLEMTVDEMIRSCFLLGESMGGEALPANLKCSLKGDQEDPGSDKYLLP